MSLLLYRKRKGKHIIQDQTELLEEARAVFVWSGFRDHIKETSKVKKECKKIYYREGPE